MVGLFAILGHCFSPFLKFNGRKGVATALGVFLVISPKATLFAATVFFFVFFLTRYVSLSSIAAALSYPTIFRFLEQPSKLSLLLVLLAATIVVAKHYSNLLRLLKGEEKRFK